MAVAGDYELQTYSWYCREKKRFDFQACLEDLRLMPEDSAIVVIGIPPNGQDCMPTAAQWEEIASLIKVGQYQR